VTRILAAVLGTLAGATVLVGCSGHTGNPSANVSVANAGPEVTVDGANVPGLDMKSVVCVKRAGNIDISSGAVNGQQGLAVLMTDEATPKVESLSIVVDGNALAVADHGGAKVGTADVAVDGKTYTISGQAVGADLRNPMAGQITKKFLIKVGC